MSLDDLLSAIAGGFNRIERRAGAFVPGFVRASYTLKFLVSILFVVLVISVLGAFAFVQAAAVVEEDTTGQLHETSGLQAEMISEWLEATEVQTRTVARSEALGSDERAGPYLREMHDYLGGDVVDVHLVDHDRDEIVASTNATLEGQSPSIFEVPWASELDGQTTEEAVWRSDRAYFSPILGGQTVIAFASAISHREDSSLVVVSAIEEQLTRTESPETAEITRIINAGGKPVFAIHEEFDEEASIHASPIEEVSSGDSQAFQEGDEHLYAYTAVDGSDWVAVTSIDKAHAFSVRDSVGQHIGILVVFSLLTLGLVGVLLSRQTLLPITRLRAKTERMEAGDLEVDLATQRTDEIGQLYRSFDTMRESLHEQISEAESALADSKAAKQEAENARGEAISKQERLEEINRDLERTASQYSSVMKACANGDLTQRMEPDADNQAMQEIATEFNAMMIELEDTVGHLDGFARDVAEASDEVEMFADGVKAASEVVEEAIEAIAEGASEQLDDLSAVSGETQTLSGSVEEIAATTDRVAVQSDRVADLGQQGMDTSRETVAKMEEIQEYTGTVVATANQLNMNAAAISDVTSIIDDIADQINMLALNASIEAARAGRGGEGEGFAVVADEIKALATETQEAVTEIEEMVTDVQEQAADSEMEIRKANASIQAGVHSVTDLAEYMESIVDGIENVDMSMQEINRAVVDQTTSAEEIVEMVEDIEAVAADTSSQSQSVTAAATEAHTSIVEVSEQASALARQADSLATVLDEFTIERDNSSGEG